VASAKYGNFIKSVWNAESQHFMHKVREFL
jgi:hypothetical protein